MPSRDPSTYRAPPTWWGQTWRVVGAVAIGILAWAHLARWQWQHDQAWFWTDVALGLAGLVVMQARRRRPVLTAVVTIAFCLVSASSGGPATVALLSLATRRRWREIVPIGLLSVTQGLIFESYLPTPKDPWPVTVTVTLAVLGIIIAVGMYIGSRRELLATLRERAVTAESEQSSRVAQARATERARIAREMHDVLAHRISLVAMHAGALSYRDDLSPDEVRRASGIIQDNAHRALVDLREVLGILRDDPTAEEPNRPQPTWCDIPTLVQEAQDVGMNVSYVDDLAGTDVPERVGRTAYRIVQEALTNARKHAADTSVQVCVGGVSQQRVEVEVRNPLRVGKVLTASPPSGLGLVGLQERTALSGGTLTHEVSGDSFVLHATLPWST